MSLPPNEVWKSVVDEGHTLVSVPSVGGWKWGVGVGPLGDSPVGYLFPGGVRRRPSWVGSVRDRVREDPDTGTSPRRGVVLRNVFGVFRTHGTPMYLGFSPVTGTSSVA